jgi:hypothetical protein
MENIVEKFNKLNIDANKKKQYGKFMTTNYKYILQHFKIPNHINTII